MKWLHLADMHIHELFSATKHAPVMFILVTWVLAANGDAGIRLTTNHRQRRCAPDVISVCLPVNSKKAINISLI